MDMSHLGSMSGAMIIGAIIALIIVILIAAGILSIINRIVNGFFAHYGRAIGVVILVGIINAIVGWIVLRVMGHSVYVPLIIGIIVQTLVGGAIMNALVRRPDGSPLGFGRAALVFLIYAIVFALLGLGFRHLAESMQGHMAMQSGVSAQ